MEKEIDSWPIAGQPWSRLAFWSIWWPKTSAVAIALSTIALVYITFEYLLVTQENLGVTAKTLISSGVNYSDKRELSCILISPSVIWIACAGRDVM